MLRYFFENKDEALRGSRTPTPQHTQAAGDVRLHHNKLWQCCKSLAASV